MEDKITRIDFTLIAKCLNHEANDAETGRLNRWIAESAANRAEYDTIRKAWELASVASGLQEWDSAGAKERFLLKVIESQSGFMRPGSRPASSLRKLLPSLMKYAALVIILLGIPAILLIRKDKATPDQPFKGQTVTEISASMGSKTHMTLADGSKVYLNAGSTITYGSEYNKHSREILLEGEAYFEVAKNTGKPFNVHAGNIIVHAIGTVFNVKAYPDESVVETTLVEGSVSVEVMNKVAHKLILMPREQVYYYQPAEPEQKNGKILISKGIETDVFTSWINDELVINNETLGSLAVKLGRKYDVKFEFDDQSLKELRFTGVLRNETIEQILDILRISSSINYRIDKREILFMKKEQ